MLSDLGQCKLLERRDGPNIQKKLIQTVTCGPSFFTKRLHIRQCIQLLQTRMNPLAKSKCYFMQHRRPIFLLPGQYHTKHYVVNIVLGYDVSNIIASLSKYFNYFPRLPRSLLVWLLGRCEEER